MLEMYNSWPHSMNHGWGNSGSDDLWSLGLLLECFFCVSYPQFILSDGNVSLSHKKSKHLQQACRGSLGYTSRYGLVPVVWQTNYTWGACQATLKLQSWIVWWKMYLFSVNRLFISRLISIMVYLTSDICQLEPYSYKPFMCKELPNMHFGF